MAKTYKVSAYWMDPNETYCLKDIERAICGEGLDVVPAQAHAEESVRYEWDDSLAAASLAEIEEMFDKRPDEKFQRDIPKAGEVWKHFKGHKVMILAVAMDTEFTGRRYVVYSHLENGKVWARPLNMFMERVRRDDYPEARYRFEKEWGCGDAE